MKIAVWHKEHRFHLKVSQLTLHTTDPTCTQPSIAEHITGQVADKMAVREHIDSAPKQAYFGHYVSQEQSNGIYKHVWLSKKPGTVVCNASSVVCRAMFWAHLFLVLYSVQVGHGDKPRAWYRAEEPIRIGVQWFDITVGLISIFCGFQPYITLSWI